MLTTATRGNCLFLTLRQPSVCLYSIYGPENTKTKYTYLLTPWCRVLLEKLTGLQLVKEFPAFHGTRRFITALTIVRHLSLSWASPIPSIYSHPTSWRSILILSTHLRLGLPSGLFPSGFPTKTLLMQSPPFLRYLVPPRSKYSPQHHVLKHSQLPFLPQCQRPSFTPIKTTGKIIVLYILTQIYAPTRTLELLL